MCLHCIGKVSNCCFCCHLLSIFKINFFKNYFRKIIRVSNNLDTDQNRQEVVFNWVQTVCKGYQQRTKFATSKERTILNLPNSASSNSSICIEDLDGPLAEALGVLADLGVGWALPGALLGVNRASTSVRLCFLRSSLSA